MTVGNVKISRSLMLYSIGAAASLHFANRFVGEVGDGLFIALIDRDQKLSIFRMIKSNIRAGEMSCSIFSFGPSFRSPRDDQDDFGGIDR
jgi:hypothetical protein